MTRDEALKKIKKCLALGRSTESHEAAAAMRQAQKLMAEFQVTDREVSLVDISEARIKACSTAINLWECWLAGAVAEAFACENFTTTVGRFNDAANYVRTRYYVFVGVDGAAEVAGYAFEVLSRQCAKARLAHIAKQPRKCKAITKTARGDEFAKGWVAAVESLVERFAGWAKDQALLLGYVAEKYPEMGTAKTRDTTKGRRLDWDHRTAGYRAGQSAEVNRGVGGIEERALLT